MMLVGFGPVLLPLPRTNAAWFVGLLIAVLGFAILVLLLVVGNCGDQNSTEPLPVTSGERAGHGQLLSVLRNVHEH